MKNTQESIICSAIWFDDGLDHPHQPINIKTGIVICGMRHCNVFTSVHLIAEKCGYDKPNLFVTYEKEQGFLTNKNRFVDRIEGRQIAIDAEQVLNMEKLGRELFSEDIF